MPARWLVASACAYEISLRAGTLPRLLRRGPEGPHCHSECTTKDPSTMVGFICYGYSQGEQTERLSRELKHNLRHIILRRIQRKLDPQRKREVQSGDFGFLSIEIRSQTRCLDHGPFGRLQSPHTRNSASQSTAMASVAGMHYSESASRGRTNRPCATSIHSQGPLVDSGR